MEYYTIQCNHFLCSKHIYIYIDQISRQNDEEWNQRRENMEVADKVRESFKFGLNIIQILFKGSQPHI